jgi:hypothetical protein
MNNRNTPRLQLRDVFTARMDGEQDAQSLLETMAQHVTEAAHQEVASTMLAQSLYPIIELAQHHRIEECMARLDGFAEIIGPVLERISAVEAKCALITAAIPPDGAAPITADEQRAINAAISTCSQVSAGRIIAVRPDDDDAIVALCELQLAIRALEPKFTETEGGEL